jgi:hypothetical protein
VAVDAINIVGAVLWLVLIRRRDFETRDQTAPAAAQRGPLGEAA